DAGVVRGSVVVPVQAHVVGAATADRDARGIELELGVLVDRTAPDHDESAHLRVRFGRRPKACGSRLFRVEHEALLGQPEVTARGANDAPDEEVEEDEERSLQEEQGALDVEGRGDHAADRRNTSSVEPTVMRSSFWSCARCWRRPFTVTPFVE